jgi:hypothetical protein
VTARSIVLALCMATTLVACGSRAQARPAAQRFDRTQLTRDELATRRTENMYTVVSSLRPNWIVTPMGASGIGSTAATAPVKVFLDGREHGGVEVLRSLGAEAVESARYYGTTEAQNKFGFRVESPVIALVSRGRDP